VRFLAGGAVSAADFYRALEKYPNPCIQDPYHFCAVLALPPIGTWAAQSEKRSPVALMYESGNKLLNKYFRDIQKDFENPVASQVYRIGSITTGDKKLIHPLQAADVIAYGVYKCKAQSSIQPYLAEAFGELWKIKNAGLVYPQDQIEKALEGVCRDLEKRQKAIAGGTP